MSIGSSNPYGTLFSSLNGSYNAASDMSNVIAQRSQVSNGSYGKLLKAYVSKVGNSAALNAYRSTGSTVSSATDLSTGTASTAGSGAAETTTAGKYAKYKSSWLDNHVGGAKKQESSVTASGKSWLDQHLKSVSGDTKSTETGGEAASTATAEAGAGTATAYSSLHSNWLDSQLKSYNQNAAVTTAANSSVAIDTAV